MHLPASLPSLLTSHLQKKAPTVAQKPSPLPALAFRGLCPNEALCRTCNLLQNFRLEAKGPEKTSKSPRKMTAPKESIATLMAPVVPATIWRSHLSPQTIQLDPSILSAVVAPHRTRHRRQNDADWMAAIASAAASPLWSALSRRAYALGAKTAANPASSSSMARPLELLSSLVAPRSHLPRQTSHGLMQTWPCHADLTHPDQDQLRHAR